MFRAFCATSAAVVVLCGHASAGLVGYRFVGVVDELMGVSGTPYGGVALNDIVEVEFMFDPELTPAGFQDDTFGWEYVIPSLSVRIGDVSPPGAPRLLPDTTLWGISNNTRDGNDAAITVGSFESGEFLVMDAVFDSPAVFVPPADPMAALPPLNLADATIVNSLGQLSISPGTGSFVGFEITSITFIPSPGVGVLGAAGLMGVCRRRR